MNGTEILKKAQQLYIFISDDKIEKKSKLIAAAALLYVISPIDVVPDAIPVLGWLDDLAIVKMAWDYIVSCVEGLEKPASYKN